ncbi:MAG: hypothetical protein ACRDP6_14695 [Actinoallomurus sp.]
MATIAVPKGITADGVSATYNAAAAGDKVTNPGKGVFLTVKNGAGTSMTLTITPPGKTGYGVANPAKVFTIPATSDMDIPMLPEYGDPADSGRVALTWSSTTTVTWAAKRIGVIG